MSHQDVDGGRTVADQPQRAMQDTAYPVNGPAFGDIVIRFHEMASADSTVV
jgi:hypothetical protein